MKLVILDDDPTGTQTISNLPVLTVWDPGSLAAEFRNPDPGFFVLTNSRALPPPEAAALNRELARNLKASAKGAPFAVVSRSDSTLRGHFPLETDVLNEELGPFHATILIPYFEAGGRVTIDDIHFVREGERLIPAADTPFARDAAFGFNASNLRDYVEEKTSGRVRREDVVAIPSGCFAAKTAEILTGCPPDSYVVVNAASPAELDRFCAGLALAEQSGLRFLFRTAAEFVRARLGQQPAPLLDGSIVSPSPQGGLVVAGSYVPKTTAQLAKLQATGIATLELSVPEMLGDQRDRVLAELADALKARLQAGEHVLLMTSRELVAADSPEDSLRIGKSVSEALVHLVGQLAAPPAWLIAKGGITSSDLATRGLGIRRAIVLGQLLPGVPVWLASEGSRFHNLPFVVFPGNVGDDNSLQRAVEKLSCAGAPKPD